MREVILVIPRTALGKKWFFQGFRDDKNAVSLSRMSTKSFFVERDRAEYDPRYKQLIIYLIVRHRDRIFLYQRIRESGEKRLLNKYSFGLGGHINPAPAADFHGLITFNLNRELREEISFRGPYSYRFLGLLNDEETEVGRYHLGLVFFISCLSPEITVNERNKLSGQLVPAAQLDSYRPLMETWSALLLPQVNCFLRRPMSPPVTP